MLKTEADCVETRGSMHVFVTHDLTVHTAIVEASSSQGEASTHMVKFHVLSCL